jgi:hypothetical protein
MVCIFQRLGEVKLVHAYETPVANWYDFETGWVGFVAG